MSPPRLQLGTERAQGLLLRRRRAGDLVIEQRQRGRPVAHRQVQAARVGGDVVLLGREVVGAGKALGGGGRLAQAVLDDGGGLQLEREAVLAARLRRLGVELRHQLGPAARGAQQRAVARSVEPARARFGDGAVDPGPGALAVASRGQPRLGDDGGRALAAVAQGRLDQRGGGGALTDAARSGDEAARRVRPATAAPVAGIAHLCAPRREGALFVAQALADLAHLPAQGRARGLGGAIQLQRQAAGQRRIVPGGAQAAEHARAGGVVRGVEADDQVVDAQRLGGIEQGARLAIEVGLLRRLQLRPRQQRLGAALVVLELPVALGQPAPGGHRPVGGGGAQLDLLGGGVATTGGHVGQLDAQGPSLGASRAHQVHAELRDGPVVAVLGGVEIAVRQVVIAERDQHVAAPRVGPVGTGEGGGGASGFAERAGVESAEVRPQIGVLGTERYGALEEIGGAAGVSEALVTHRGGVHQGGARGGRRRPVGALLEEIGELGPVACRLQRAGQQRRRRARLPQQRHGLLVLAPIAQQLGEAAQVVVVGQAALAGGAQPADGPQRVARVRVEPGQRPQRFTCRLAARPLVESTAPRVARRRRIAGHVAQLAGHGQRQRCSLVRLRRPPRRAQGREHLRPL